MDYKKLLKETKNLNKLSVTLKKSEQKGVGLYTTKTIKKGDVIAYYKVKIFKNKGYVSPTDFVYSIEIYRKNGDAYKTLIGDIDKDSFPAPLDNIPFWAPFANEPSKNERINSEIDVDLRGNYKDKTFSNEGESAVYKLVATKMIRPDEEVLWYYGDIYDRKYNVGKSN